MAVAAFICVLACGAQAEAQCCSGYSLATSCSGVPLTKSRWCIQNSAPTGQNALPTAFCAYGDKVVSSLEMVFNINAPGIFEFELDTQTGGAHTGTACANLGAGVAYDAFVGSAYGATGFWGYLLSLHEAINVWTGMSSSGWPTDWWADHQSAFPNLMDFHIMNTIGTSNNDANLLKAATAQKTRFYPGGDSADPKVVALDNVYMAMPNGDGYAGFSSLFAMQSGDGVKWDSLGVPNPDVKRSEYVVGYMSLAARQLVLKLLQGPGANGGGNICNNTPDGTAGDQPYTCSEANIDAIATAHCAIAANGKQAAHLSALRSGNYASVPSGPCGSTCPSECACDAASHCVAYWLGTPSDGGVDAGVDAGTGGARGDASLDTGGAGMGGRAGSSGGRSDAATAGAGGTSDSGRAGAGGAMSDASTTDAGGTGVAGTGGMGTGGGGAGTGGNGASGSSAAGGAGPQGGAGNGGSSDGGNGSNAGCGCRTVGDWCAPRLPFACTAFALAAVALTRTRARRR
ncbi:MAG TPA: hypothetical protein VK550_18165 [Polyangiaceae bacterium]|nr:hypothetical protein [Polyangiaceae bacterium]